MRLGGRTFGTVARPGHSPAGIPSGGNDMENSWGSLVREIRRLMELKQSEMAVFMEVDERTIQRWESGKQIPAPQTRAALERIFDGLRTTRLY